MKSCLAFLLVISISISSLSQVNPKNTQHDAAMNQYVSTLMQKMTLEEKIGQLNLPSIGFDVTGPVLSQGVEEKIRKGLVGGVFNTYTPIAVRKLQQLAVNETRLKIPLLFGYDVIHGHRTIFPIALGLSSSWDTALIERTARAAALEATADGLNWVFSPMVDIARDPRWGRVSEGAGEDPWLGSQIAKAMVKGYQGTDLSKDNAVLACVKHFALYGAGEAGRDYNTVDMSRIRMFNEYLLPYKAAVEAGVGSIMSSFNEIDGVPASGNKWLLTDLLRRQWGFRGLVVSDYTSINEMVNHGVGDEKKVGELSLNAGLDMDMVGEIFIRYGIDLVKSGRVAQTQVDAACRRILEAKYKLGLFQDPYRFVNEERPAREMMSADKLELSKEAAMKSMVLLKNAGQALPLQANKKIAFIGPLVKNQRDLIGSWSGAGDWKKAVSIWDALQQKFGADKFLYAKGCNLVQDSVLRKRLNDHDGQLTIDPMSPAQMIDQAVQTANQADVVVAVLGEAFGMTGEAASRSMIGLLENQLELLKALKNTGKPIVLVLMSGRPLTLEWENANCEAILETWFSGSQAGNAIASVLFGEYNPSGKLSMTFPRNTGQIPIYYNAKNTGRPIDPNNKYSTKYLDVPNTPLYPFGFGLSYTTFNYGEIQLSSASIKPGASITASVAVTNTGKFDGVETVQLYVRDMIGSISRPVKELRGFKKISLKVGESGTVHFKITVDDLKFFNADLKFVAEPGDFKLFIGGNSQDVKEIGFTLVK
ncbi:MAG: beta-glucosidase BglX [Chitinophagaceae bacterium]|nr:beta-glucosidase BglX [Chitinophagaceae bacterium]